MTGTSGHETGSEARGTPPRIRSVITWLEMTEPAAGMVDAALANGLPPSISVEHRRDLSVPLYRDLYRRVGEPWLWWERLRLSDDELAAIVADPAIEIRLFRRGADIVGYCELDRHDPANVELVYFGLVPEAIGRGWGRSLLAATLGAAWFPPAGLQQPRRVWLHTCTEDHPGALAFYRAAGFRPYRTEEVLIDDPRATGVLPPDAAPHVPAHALGPSAGHDQVAGQATLEQVKGSGEDESQQQVNHASGKEDLNRHVGPGDNGPGHAG